MTQLLTQCPSCHQPVGSHDFMCARCELVIDPSLATHRPRREVSLVRRMLEGPQAEVPRAGRPARAVASAPKLGEERPEPTRLFKLNVEQFTVPFVMTTLAVLPRLTEFEAWFVSMIDGVSPVAALSRKVALNEFETCVVLNTLFDKGVVAFAEDALSDADLGLPQFIDVDIEVEVEVAPPRPASVPARSVIALGVAEPPMLAAAVEAPVAEAIALGVAPVHKSDTRIAYSGSVNPRVLEALKKVRRSDVKNGQAAAPEKTQSLADIRARETLQVAIRMEQNGRFEEAIRFLEKSIAQSPEAASLYNRLGIILMRDRVDYRRAENMIRKAIELDPENEVYAANLHQVFALAALRRQ